MSIKNRAVKQMLAKSSESGRPRHFWASVLRFLHRMALRGAL